MQSRRFRPIDIVSAGELLVDFISSRFVRDLQKAVNFKRLQGGSPANLCINMARLGNASKLVATVGNDQMGVFLRDAVAATGVDTSLIREIDLPTTLILVTRSKKVSNFQAYRAADSFIYDEQMTDELLSQTSLFHTTCFALSRIPAQVVIFEAAQRAMKLGCQVSIDANYSPKIWSDREEAQRYVTRYCELGALVKVSEVDWERLYEEPLKDPEHAARHFLNMGARQVCVTLGKEGCLVADHKGANFLPSREVEVKDTTGAGDAFWSGYLTAWLDGYNPLQCATAGRRMAELKLAHFGPFPGPVDKNLVFEEIICR
ncbi:MAG: sugar kinase [Saprospiraceae bacterium]|nr:sugar kinase [Saprospiraceae bacterium]